MTQTTPDELIEVHAHNAPGFLPVVDFEAWRVAMFNGGAGDGVRKIDRLNKHVETDEVFVLLQGRCLLFLATGDETVETIYAQNLEPLKAYNVKQAVWHGHLLSDDAKVLIVENRATTAENSPGCLLTAAQRRQLIELAGSFDFNTGS